MFWWVEHNNGQGALRMTLSHSPLMMVLEALEVNIS